ncbi:MAG TPA: TM0106 family RecB-like putative nuclease [Chryseosolibacter sp.]|nr:TM0106 family RecB-like putative nuclease [Chryseosolibacter sp.]
MRYTDNGFQLSATDLSNHLCCEHLTQLRRLVALDKIKEPHYHDPSLDALIKRGESHEAAYVNYLNEKKGLSIVCLRGKETSATLEAMKEGVDVIVQAKLEDGQWMGYTDILLKVPGKSKFGSWSYEVQDTKLAQNTRAATILQLCLYTDLLSKLLDATPDKMYVVKPGDDFPTEAFSFAHFQAYYRLIRKNFEAVIAGPALTTYPDPVDHCHICKWWKVCDQKRHDDDHLSLVAGIRNLHITELQKQNVFTLEQFATIENIEKTERGNRDTFIRKQQQAKVQLDGRLLGALKHRALPRENARGLHRLPEPGKGDIYFDIEGDPFYPGGGLEYLLGYAYQEADGTLVYRKIWATDRLEEKKAFSEFMQFVAERWKRYPKMYIYHFAPYEPGAVKRLARVHAVHEADVDKLLRAERFIDLHAVFKEALLASVERYSLKELEKFTKYIRKIDLRDAGMARKSVEYALELNDFKALSPETLRIVEDYNEDDCIATEALHRWLEDLRHQSEQEYTRPELKFGEASENVQTNDTRAQRLFEALINNLPENTASWSDEDHAKWLLAHQIEYFRREDKSAWWEYYRVHELEHEELLDERKAITGLEFVEVLPLRGRDRIAAHRYRYPPQEVSIDEGDDLIEVKGEKIGTVQAIALDKYTIDIKKTGKTIDRHPRAVHVSERVDPGSLATSLMNLAQEIDENGLDHRWAHQASKDLLMKRAPRLTGGKKIADLSGKGDALNHAIQIALELERSILPIQGPPGAGKTYAGASMILALLMAKKKVGVTAISHSVIRTMFEKVKELADKEGTRIGFVHKVTDKTDIADWIVEVTDSTKALAALHDGKLVGGTAWLWADDRSQDTLDYLFVDEAGQMSLSQALAASRSARNLILLGDPQQLEQPQRGAHPEGSDVAALTYLLDGHLTMPEGKGLFLDTTWRMHPDISGFTSEMFYEGRLKSVEGLEKQAITGGTPFDGAGLFYVPVEHKGNQNKSPEEITVIAEIVNKLLRLGEWTNGNGNTRPLTKQDILIVAPYNAQVAALIEKLPDVPIGTVDKFQGREAPVVIYSMTASTTEDAPRGMNFLFSPNRLNVATSRARSVCILVAAPKLLEPGCKTIEQMRWANALCRFREMAREVSAAVV